MQQETEAAAHPIPLDGETPLDAAMRDKGDSPHDHGYMVPAERPEGCCAQMGTVPFFPGHLRADTLGRSLFLLLALTMLQRVVGFLREILFCRWLDAEQLGQWDMAFGFLMLAAPLAVLSLPGTFGRYVERYRQLGQLHMFLRRTGVFCIALAVPATVALFLARRWFSELIFGTPGQTGMIMLLAGSLLAVIAFNYLISLFTALRNMRIVSGMELVNSLLFAAIGLGLMRGWQATAGSVVVAYGAACLVCSLVAMFWLGRAWQALPDVAAPAPQRELWATLLPFAAWILAINMLTNLFDYADRQMILHCFPGTPEQAMAEVGNYRSSRVVPLLLASITSMIATVITPHLSHDWEAGRRERVSARLNLILKSWSIALTGGAVLVLWAAPLFFEVAFRGKYAGGLAVLPWTLTYCAWFGLAMIAQKFLWCAERAGLAGLALGTGLAVNVGLNFLLLPRLGLLGAVLATAAANFVALALVVALSKALGFHVHRGTWAMLALPMVVCLGPWLASLALAAVLLETFGSDRLLSAEEKDELFAGARQYLDKLPWLRRRFASS